MTLSLFGFVSRLQDHISLSDTFDTVIIHIGMYLAKIVYHYRKRQLVSTDRSVPIPIHRKIDGVRFR